MPTYDANVPNASQSPGVFPLQNAANFTRLKTIIDADHVFNDTDQSTDGYHNQCTMIVRAKPTGVLPTGSNGIFYSYLDVSSAAQLGFYNGVKDFNITPFSLLAAVNFQGGGSPTIRSSFNVSSVSRSSVGRYTVTYTNALPNNNYMVQITSKAGGTSGISNGSVYGGSTYATSVTTTNLLLVFNGSGSDLLDPSMGSILIFGV